MTLIVTTALDDLAVPYAIGGSLASALHGVVRATMDADIIAAMKPRHVAKKQPVDRGLWGARCVPIAYGRPPAGEL